MISRLSILALAVALAACDSARPANGAEGVPGNEAAASLAAPAAPPDAASSVGTVALTLDGDGVRLVDPATGSATPLPFGAPMATAIAALGAAFGGPPADQVVNHECGAGPILHARWANGFVLLAQEDRFLGWDSREPGLTTADGIGIGSTRAELEASREIEVAETTLGMEFSAGALGGLLASADSAAPVTSLWAGLTCHFR